MGFTIKKTLKMLSKDELSLRLIHYQRCLGCQCIQPFRARIASQLLQSSQTITTVCALILKKKNYNKNPGKKITIASHVHRACHARKDSPVFFGQTMMKASYSTCESYTQSERSPKRICFSSSIETKSLAIGATDTIHDGCPTNETDLLAVKKFIDAVLCSLGFRFCELRCNSFLKRTQFEAQSCPDQKHDSEEPSLLQ